MHSSLRFLAVLVLFVLAAPSLALAQEDQTSIISLYRVAPGHHMAFMQWMADQEAASADAGVPAGQWYVHLNGDSWDFLFIGPELTDEQSAAVDAAAAARGLKTGPAASIELREHMAWHTDTYVAGPMTAAELLAGAQEGGS